MPVRCFGGHGVTALPWTLPAYYFLAKPYTVNEIKLSSFPAKIIAHKGTKTQRKLILVPLCLRVKKYNVFPFVVYNPAVWDASSFMNQLRESACDNLVDVSDLTLNRFKRRNSYVIKQRAIEVAMPSEMGVAAQMPSKPKKCGNT